MTESSSRRQAAIGIPNISAAHHERSTDRTAARKQDPSLLRVYRTQHWNARTTASTRVLFNWWRGARPPRRAPRPTPPIYPVRPHRWVRACLDWDAREQVYSLLFVRCSLGSVSTASASRFSTFSPAYRCMCRALCYCPSQVCTDGCPVSKPATVAATVGWVPATHLERPGRATGVQRTGGPAEPRVTQRDTRQCQLGRRSPACPISHPERPAKPGAVRTQCQTGYRRSTGQ